jgi:aspartyl-tRNA synthetase
MRTEYCGLVDERYIGREVSLYGWVHRRRDHGGVIFIDLRDREGIVQIVCDPDVATVFARAEGLRSEFCVQVSGLVRPRPQGTANAALTSGAIEVLCRDLTVLNASVPPPFQLDDDDLSETTRLTHRVLDLRRPAMQKNLRLRYRVAMAVRRFLDAKGFLDIETPMLTQAARPKARATIWCPRGSTRACSSPCRSHRNCSSSCSWWPATTATTRSSSASATRTCAPIGNRNSHRSTSRPRFSMKKQIRELMETMIRDVFREVLDVSLPDPFPVMRYAQAMALYGSDKPDLRVRLQLTELTDVMRDVEFKIFRAATEPKDGRVAHLRCPAAAPWRARRSTPTPNSSASTAPRGWPTSRSTSARRAAMACSRPSSRACTTTRWRRSWNAPARATAT